MSSLVLSNSKGYGYSYASLGDIAAQGFAIPKMKTVTEDGREFLHYYDTDLREWIRGAEIVVPDSKGMNKAQLYGSALTYARRYTTLMALQLACGDDSLIENLNADGSLKNEEPKKETKKPKGEEVKETPKAAKEKPKATLSEELLEVVKGWDKNLQVWILNKCKVKNLEDLPDEAVKQTIKAMEEKKNG